MSNWWIQKQLWEYKIAKKLFDLRPCEIKHFNWYSLNLSDLLDDDRDKLYYGYYLDSIGIELEKDVYWGHDVYPIHFRDKVHLDSVWVEWGEVTFHFEDAYDNWWDIEVIK